LSVCKSGRRKEEDDWGVLLILLDRSAVALVRFRSLSFNPMTDTLTGSDGNPFKLEAPKPAPEVPAKNFARGKSYYVAPKESDRDFELKIAPDSERLQGLQPWPAWSGDDFLDVPVLLKTKGKTTTDHISPAGSWLRHRGHLDKFSDNIFMGATNAYTDAAGVGKNVLSGEADQSFSKIARDYKSHGVHWVVVGDFNYGEGSSREHAALSPRTHKRDQRSEQNCEPAEQFDENRDPGEERGRSESMEYRREGIGPAGQFCIAVLHEAKPDDEPKRYRKEWTRDRCGKPFVQSDS
jgi:hypothetical protein